MTKTYDDIALASGDYLAVVKDFAMSRGIQASDLLAGSALDPADFIHPPEMVSNFIVNRIGHNLYARLENPIAEAVYYGMKVTPSSHGSLGVAIQSCKCLREGLDVLKKYYGTRLASQSPEINEHGKYLDIQLKSSFRGKRT